MIETDKRKAIFLLHEEGMSKREIARRLGVCRNAVGRIIGQKGQLHHKARSDKQQIDPELLRRLYEQCQGRMERMREKLVEEEGIPVKYSTLTRMLREQGISKAQKVRCERVPDEPGAEMQHDTSTYQVKLSGQTVKVVASMIYLRYSKRRYLKFYRAFDRFQMKCFFHQALLHWGYSARQCVIDNTSLARLRGSGSAAVIVPEMEIFSRQYGFGYLCHEKGHCNRKAGEERSFWTVETNFLPGRLFQDMTDLNQQALEWSTVRMDNRPQSKTGLIPAKAFEYETGFLFRLPAHLPAPYQIHHRGTDQYGYVAFGGNFYWVPGTGRDEVRVLQYADHLKIYLNRKCLAEYLLPAQEVRNQRFSPEGLPAPRHQPNNRSNSAQEEQKQLRAIAPIVETYLDFALQIPGLQRQQFLRKLFILSQRMTPSLFVKTVERAFKYQIHSLDTLERIALLHLNEGIECLSPVEVDEHLQERDTYQEGLLTEKPDLSIYDPPTEL